MKLTKEVLFEVLDAKNGGNMCLSTDDKYEVLSRFGNAGLIDKKLSELCIPKKVAKLIDAGDPLYLAWAHGNDLLLEDGGRKKREEELVKRKAIISIYIASKAIGDELVEVVDE